MSFVSAFSKTAASHKAESKKTDKKIDRAIGTAAMSGSGAALAGAMSLPLAAPIVVGRSNPAKNEEFLRKAKAHHGISPGWEDPHQFSFGSRKSKWHERLKASYQPGFGHGHGTIKTPKDIRTSVLAHEFGHAIHLAKNPRAKLHVIGGRMASPLLGGALGAGLASSDDPNVRKYAPAAVAAGAAPMLYQEGRATYHGTKEIARQLGKKKALKSLLVTAPAFGTYLSRPVGAYLGAKYFLDREKNKKAKHT